MYHHCHVMLCHKLEKKHVYILCCKVFTVFIAFAVSIATSHEEAAIDTTIEMTEKSIRSFESKLTIFLSYWHCFTKMKTYF